MKYGKSTAYLLAFGGPLRPCVIADNCGHSCSPPGHRDQPNAMSGSKFGSNGLALSLSARRAMGHSRNESREPALAPPPKIF